MYNLRSKRVVQLTNDRFSDYQPHFSGDGNKIVFTSDRTTLDRSSKSVDITFNLAVIDLTTKTVTDINVFNGANNLNPQFSANSESLYFLSNRDGFRNLYRYNLITSALEQLTDYFTGISGITEFSPALSVSRNDDILYSYYRAQKYSIYNAKADQFKPKSVDPNALNFDAAILPPGNAVGVDIINANLNNFERFEKISSDSIKDVPYRPKFKLDYLSSNGVGASVGRFGGGLSSGVQGVFSDILGLNQIYATAAVNGEIYDFGGQVAYINQESRINWGGAISHIPYVSGYGFYRQGTAPSGQPSVIESNDIIRTFEDQVQVFGSYPFSRIHRFESGVGAAYYSYRIDRFNTYYDLNGFGLFQDREKLSKEQASQDYGTAFESFKILQLNSAFVGDNSVSGVTSPLDGFRYRVGVEGYMGDYSLGAFTLDLRKYLRMKPVTLAVRGYSYSRFGRDEDRLYPLFVGYNYLVRGYEANSFYKKGTGSVNGFDINQLVGTKIAVANIELRLPFTGPKRLAAVESKFLFSDLNAFFDFGLAWDKNSQVAFKSEPSKIGTRPNPQTGQTEDVYERIPAMSAGVSLRVNVFGYFVLEPYFAIPFQRKDIKGGVFGLTFAPGW
jgi:hypothetical protein